MSEVQPPDAINLLKIVWTPDDVVAGQVQPVAFDLQDLKTLDRRVSVDREDMLNSAHVMHIAERQAARAQSSPNPNVRRDEAHGTWLNCGAVRSLQALCEERVVYPLSVESDPVEGNDAHCAVGNTSGNKGRAFRLQLQTKLAALTFGTDLLRTILDQK